MRQIVFLTSRFSESLTSPKPKMSAMEFASRPTTDGKDNARDVVKIGLS